MTADTFSATVTAWYDEFARDLPWRAPGVSPWGVLVSEVMLQQTPAARVSPAWVEWLRRWPDPAALAAASPGEAVRAWDRLGYPRRALRLHASAVVLVERHDGEVPSSYDELLALPGVGPYTASAVLAFGFGRRHAVLDTNVRRVHARRFDGRADAATAAPTVRERAAALARVPDGGAARHSVAVMELGALVCTARAPRCQACPLLVECRWRAAGRPELPPRRPAQRFTGTDRQVRGRLMALLRATSEPVPATVLARVWDDDTQRDRALAGLLADGLVERLGADGYRLPA